MPPQSGAVTVGIVVSGFESLRQSVNRVAGLAILLWPLAGCAGSGQELPSGATVRIPPGIPEGWSSPVAATFEGRVPQGRVFAVLSANRNGNLAQLDPETGILWLMGDLPAAGVHSVKTEPEVVEGAFQVTADAQGYLVSEGERPVFFYQSAPRSLDGRYTRAGYVHPLYGLDGRVLTHDFPEDHFHHRGIFWAWHQLWVGDERAGDPWLTEDFLTEVENVRVHDGPLFSVLEASALWTSPLQKDGAGELLPLVRERVRIQVFRSTQTLRSSISTSGSEPSWMESESVVRRIRGDIPASRSASRPPRTVASMTCWESRKRTGSESPAPGPTTAGRSGRAA